jgi:hypothetical protein
MNIFVELFPALRKPNTSTWATVDVNTQALKEEDGEAGKTLILK